MLYKDDFDSIIEKIFPASWQRRIKNCNKSILLAGSLSLFLIIWIATSNIIIGGQGDTNEIESIRGRQLASNEAQLLVRVATQGVENHARTLKVTGRTEASARLVVKTETAARLSNFPRERGAYVQKGDLICELEIGVRQARLTHAESRLAQVDLEFNSAKKLKEKGFATDSRVKMLQADYNAAIATISEAKLDIERTRILAPFPGIIADYNTEVGDFLPVGSACVTLVSYDPIRVSTKISEQFIRFIRLDTPATISLVTGEHLSGKASFISQSSDRATHTFRVEFEVQNPDNDIRDGVTAQISIELEPVLSHKINPDSLLFNDSGIVGIKIVDLEKKVQFIPVEIIENTSDAVWIAKLDEQIDVITIGQHYADIGQVVKVNYENRIAVEK